MSAPPLPWYRPVGQELSIFEVAYRQRLPLMLKGPTGCGKSRFVEHMAARLGRPLVTVSCHDETSAVDLVGRYLITGGQTEWQDGPLTRAVRQGAILYLDEVAEARPDVVVLIHPLTDHRRRLVIDRRDETVEAPPEFMLVVSWNPGYQRGLKELKPSTRQRFLGIDFSWPAAEVETEVVVGETGVDAAVARRLVALAGRLRGAEAVGLTEPPSTRLLVHAAQLIGAGLPPRLACRTAIIESVTDDTEVRAAVQDLINLAF